MINIRAFLGLEFYISELDQFLNNFDRNHKLSAAQESERKKYARIHDLRDHAKPHQTKPGLWDKF